MKQTEVNRFNKLYERHLRLLKLQGKSLSRPVFGGFKRSRASHPRKHS